MNISLRGMISDHRTDTHVPGTSGHNSLGYETLTTSGAGFPVRLNLLEDLTNQILVFDVPGYMRKYCTTIIAHTTPCLRYSYRLTQNIDTDTDTDLTKY